MHIPGDIACGVPIMGYANEGFADLLGHCDAGGAKPLDDSSAMVDRIVQVGTRREERASYTAAHIPTGSSGTRP